MKQFEIIDHTADVGVSAYGATREQLFENAARGMFSIICDVDTSASVIEHEIAVDAADPECLLAKFLSELLYVFEVEHFMPHDIRVVSLSDTAAEAVVSGENIGPQHALFTEIKAVTHHQLKVEQTESGWHAFVLFDI